MGRDVGEALAHIPDRAVGHGDSEGALEAVLACIETPVKKR